MKKQSFLIMAGALFAFASCTNDNNGEYTQAQVDSMVNTRVEEMKMEMMMQNDSIINSLATLRADSMLAAMKGGNTVTTHTTRTTTVKNTGGTKTPVTPVDNTPKNTGKNGDQSNGTNTGKKGNQDEGTNTGKR